ncbi:MAG TPA: hypothetical protein VIJ18_16105 [Microbacteriaceae bacterium]
MTEYREPSDVEDLITSEGFHIGDRNLLLSALAAPLPVFGEEVYPGLNNKAAALLVAINRDQPLSDGNKRLSWISMYEVTAELDGRFWLVRVPAIDRVTQARNVGEIQAMASDLITVMTGEEAPEVRVQLLLPEAITERLQRLAEAREAEMEARRVAAEENRAVARMLRAQHLTLADVGSVLGVSHQRAAQLVDA